MAFRKPASVILLDEEGKRIGQMSRESARKLAESRRLRLGNLADLGIRASTSDNQQSTKAITLQLFTGARLFELQKRAAQVKKEQRSSKVYSKTFYIQSKSSAHDLDTKLKHIVELLGERNEILVIIQVSKRGPIENDTVRKKCD